jgi:hypothetical protein
MQYASAFGWKNTDEFGPKSSEANVENLTAIAVIV